MSADYNEKAYENALIELFRDNNVADFETTEKTLSYSINDDYGSLKVAEP